MKLVMIAVVAILLLGGGAAGAYFYFDKPAEAAAGPVDMAKKATHEAKKEAAAKEGEEGAPKEQFVQMEPLILPIIGDDGVTQTVSLVVSLAVPDMETAKEVKYLSPRLKDAFIQDMYGVLNRKNVMLNGVLQVNQIKARLNKVSEKVLGKDKVSDVLLQVVQQRSL